MNGSTAHYIFYEFLTIGIQVYLTFDRHEIDDPMFANNSNHVFWYP